MTIASSTPNVTPIEEITSESRCLPSATSVGERSCRPWVMSTQHQKPLRKLATAFTSRPEKDASSGRGTEGRGRPVQDHERGDDDHHAFEQRAEELGLVVPVGMVRVCGPGGNPDRHEAGEPGREVHNALQRVRQERDRAGHLVGERLEPQDDDAQDQTAQGELDDLRHGQIRIREAGP